MEVEREELVTLDGSRAFDNVAIVRWNWSFIEGGEVVRLEGESVSYRVDEPGNYEVTLTVVDEEGNEATESFDIEVMGSGWLWFALLFAVVAAGGLGLFLVRRRGTS
jgi:hypothetical protein